MSAPRLALHGGTPVRTALLPYGRQSIDEADVQAVAAVLRSDWLTTGPAVGEFERAFAKFTGSREAVAVSSGTAALHAAMHALDIGPGDEVIVPAITFVASANCVLYMGGTPVFADVDPDTLLVSALDIEARITARTKAIIAVDYAGQPCDYDALRALAARHGLPLVADACHALGGASGSKQVGSLADLSTFSLHPVKPATTGEGGVITTDDEELAARLRRFRSHGITSDFRQREQQGSWHYEMTELGFNYRITDFQCALGLGQLRKLPGWALRRQAIARRYDEAFAGTPFRALRTRPEASHAYHLYVVRLDLERLTATRDEIFAAFRAENIGVNVHYMPVYLHPYYETRFGARRGLCRAAETVYEEILTLPLFAAMSDDDVDDVVRAARKIGEAFQR